MGSAQAGPRVPTLSLATCSVTAQTQPRGCSARGGWAMLGVGHVSEEAPQGCNQAGGVTLRPHGPLRVRSNGGPCSAPIPPSLAVVLKGAHAPQPAAKAPSCRHLPFYYIL